MAGHAQAGHGGKAYDAAFGNRMTGTGPYADLLARRIEVAKRKLAFTGACGARHAALSATC
jgi:hypothetical protein